MVATCEWIKCATALVWKGHTPKPVANNVNFVPKTAILVHNLGNV